MNEVPKIKDFAILYEATSLEEVNENYSTVIIMDISFCQVTLQIHSSYKTNSMFVFSGPANMGKYNQLLDVKLNCEAKRFLQDRSVDWYLN